MHQSGVQIFNGQIQPAACALRGMVNVSNRFQASFAERTSSVTQASDLFSVRRFRGESDARLPRRQGHGANAT
jgi:hypothetical protein